MPDYLPVSILALPSMPWCYPALNLKEQTILSDAGLLKAYTSPHASTDPDRALRCLFFPSKHTQVNEERITCDRAAWRRRQALAYFLNIHTMSHGGWATQDLCRKLEGFLTKPWYPGRYVDGDSIPQQSVGNKSFLSVDELYIQPAYGEPSRQVHKEDLYVDDERAEWELSEGGVNADLFTLGARAWGVVFQKHIRSAWKKHGLQIQEENVLTRLDLWRTTHPTPDAAANTLGDKPSPAPFSEAQHTQFYQKLTAALGLPQSQPKASLQNMSRQLLNSLCSDQEKGFQRLHKNWRAATKEVEGYKGIFMFYHPISIPQTSPLENTSSIAETPQVKLTSALESLRDAEIKLFGNCGALQEGFNAMLNSYFPVFQVSACNPCKRFLFRHKPSIPTTLHLAKNSVSARHIPFTEGNLLEFAKYIGEWAAQLQTKHDEDPKRTKWLSPLKEVEQALHCANGILPGMRTDAPKLMEHQLRAVCWLKMMIRTNQSQLSTSPRLPNPGCMIADAPGMGKTLIILGFLSYSRCVHAQNTAEHGGQEAMGPIVITCPSSVYTQWRLEAHKWISPGGMDFFLYPTSQNERLAWWAAVFEPSLISMDWRVIIVSHSTLAGEFTDFEKGGPKANQAAIRSNTIFGIKPRLIIVDEAHSARNPYTNLYKAIRYISTGAHHTILLTATPIHNQVEDVFSLMDLINLNHSDEEKQRIKTISSMLPILRSRAVGLWQQKLLNESHNQSLSQDTILDDDLLMKDVDAGREFLQTLIACIKHLFLGRYIRRDHDDPENPLLRLSGKTVHICKVPLSQEESVWYKEERERSREGNSAKGSVKSKNFLSNERRGLIHRLSYLVTSQHMKNWVKSDQIGQDVAALHQGLLQGSQPDPTPSTKLNKLVEILRSTLDEDKKLPKQQRRKTLIYCAWPSLSPVIQAHLKSQGIPTMVISENAGSKRDGQVAEFQTEAPHTVEDAESYVAIISSSVSTGVNITRASTIILLVSELIARIAPYRVFPKDIPWSYQQSQQIQGRVYRVGQTRHVDIHKIVTIDTVDEDLLQLSSAKGVASEMFNLGGNLFEEAAPEVPKIEDLKIRLSPRKKTQSKSAEERELEQEMEFQRKKEEAVKILQNWNRMLEQQTTFAETSGNISNTNDREGDVDEDIGAETGRQAKYEERPLEVERVASGPYAGAQALVPASHASPMISGDDFVTSPSGMPDLNQADQVAVVQKQDSSPPVVNAYPRCPPHPPLARSELITAADKSPNNLAEDNSSYGQSAEHAVSVESKNHRPSRPNPTVYPGDLGSISNFLRTPQPNPFKPANDASYHVNSSAHSVELGVGSHEQRSGLDMVFKGVIKPKKSAVDEELSTTSDEQMDISLPKYKTIIPRSKKPQISSQTGMAGKRASRGATPGVLGHDRSGVGRNSNTGTSSGGPRTTATKRKRISEGDKPERYYVEEDSGLSDVQIAEPKHLGLAQAPARPSQAKPALTRPLQSQSSKTRPQPSSLNRNKKPRVAADHEEELRLQETDRQITDLFQ